MNEWNGMVRNYGGYLHGLHNTLYAVIGLCSRRPVEAALAVLETKGLIGRFREIAEDVPPQYFYAADIIVAGTEVVALFSSSLYDDGGYGVALFTRFGQADDRIVERFVADFQREISLVSG